jgi:hypothetical protein
VDQWEWQGLLAMVDEICNNYYKKAKYNNSSRQIVFGLSPTASPYYPQPGQSSDFEKAIGFPWEIGTSYQQVSEGGFLRKADSTLDNPTYLPQKTYSSFPRRDRCSECKKDQLSHKGGTRNQPQ